MGEVDLSITDQIGALFGAHRDDGGAIPTNGPLLRWSERCVLGELGGTTHFDRIRP